MASDSVERTIGEVEALTGADPNFARMWMRDAWQRTTIMRSWSCLWKQANIVLPDAITNVSTGETCTVTQDSDEIVFSAAIATDAMVGRQIRVGGAGPIYSIRQRLSSTRIRVFPAYADSSGSGKAFTIYAAYVALPADCRELLSVINPRISRRLHLNFQRELLDQRDAGRTRSGDPRLLSPIGWSSTQIGRVEQPVRVVGTGPKPVSGGEYAGALDAMFVVQVTTGGLGSAVVFSWSKDEGAATTGVAADTSVGNQLADGVSVLWDPAETYIVNAVFVIQAKAQDVPGAPLQEVYPHCYTRTVLQVLYASSYPDITADGVVIPSFFEEHISVLREYCLEQASALPGIPYSQINRRSYHAGNWVLMTRLLEVLDNKLAQRNVQMALPLADLPWSGADLQMYDARNRWTDF